MRVALALVVVLCIVHGGDVHADGLAEDGRLTLAIYDDGNRLLTTPVVDWQRATESAADDAPITDVFVIAHGWNYTIPEALSNYQKYVEIIDRNADGAAIRPVFVFVVWSSITRPLSEASRSLLPFGLDVPLATVAGAIDSIAFHLPSAWKQSINAYTNALGRRLPATYRQQSYDEVPFTSLVGDDRRAGRDLPVSFLLHELIRRNREQRLDQRIHVIGHSFGAKLVALAALEALERISESGDPQGAIASLLLFNGALHASELQYQSVAGVFDSGATRLEPRTSRDRTTELLRMIPRKAAVFSNTDYTTGSIFDLSQKLFNTRQLQITNANVVRAIDANHERGLPGRILNLVSVPPIATVQLAGHVGATTGEWFLRSLVFPPLDFAHHVRSNAALRSVCNNLACKAANVPLFFVPVQALVPGTPADAHGLIRFVLPALGRSGPHAIGAGRPELDFNALANTWAFAPLLDPAAAVGADEFEALACNTTTSPRKFDQPDWFHSIDASKVFDTWTPPVGSHTDLGSRERASCSNRSIEKREATFHFISHFTR